jgi:hypothetical protein
MLQLRRSIFTQSSLHLTAREASRSTISSAIARAGLSILRTYRESITDSRANPVAGDVKMDVRVRSAFRGVRKPLIDNGYR